MGVRIALLALAVAGLLTAQRSFTETDPAATQCNSTEVIACSGGTIAATPGSSLAVAGGTAGTTEDSLQISANTQRVLYWFEAAPSDASTWPAGNYVTRVNITSADADGQWDHTHICRMNSTCSSVLGTIGSITNQNTSVATTGVKTHTVSGASQAAGATDLVLIVLTFEDTAIHGNMSVGITPNQAIDTPLVAAARNRAVVVQ